MNLQEILNAVAEGKTVYWSNPSYIVFDGGKAGMFIKCLSNGHGIGLTWADNETLNGKEQDFYIANELRRPEWETQIKNIITDTIYCVYSDASAIFDAQPFIVAKYWAMGHSPETTAKTILEA